jgi:hypothetical protein
METSPSRIDLKSIIQVDKIENILSSLITQLDRQEKTIEQLQKSSDSGHMTKVIANLEFKVQELTLKVEAMEAASTVKLGNDLR